MTSRGDDALVPGRCASSMAKHRDQDFQLSTPGRLTHPPTSELKISICADQAENEQPALVASAAAAGAPSTREKKRREIEATLRRLHDAAGDERERDANARKARHERTRCLLKLMQLDTEDQTKVVANTAQVALKNEVNEILDQMRALEDRYQREKKEFALIPDKTERHRLVRQAKGRRDHTIAPLRERLRELDPEARSLTSYEKPQTDASSRLPSLRHGNYGHNTSSSVFRQVTEQICELQKSRQLMLDPYAANLKMARLWSRINDDVRALENYEKALRPLSEQHKAKIPLEEMEAIHELERRRRRESAKFLFTRYLDRGEREHAAKLMRLYLSLSSSSERLDTVRNLEKVLRQLNYVEDPALSSPDAMTLSILSSKSLGCLTDLRFELLKELLAASPQDPYLLEAVATFHVRKNDFCDARSVGDRYVKLPEVQRLQLFSSFREYRPKSP